MNAQENRPKHRPKKGANVPLWAALAAAVAALGWGLGPGRWFRGDAEPELRGAKVQRGPLRISVLQRGNLAAKDSVSIKSEIEGQTTVLYLIDEGTFVKAGELLVELDAADLVERKVTQEISLQNAEAAFTKAKAAYEIQESQNQSDIEMAERKLKFAELDRNKYLQGDLEQLRKQADDKILLAQQKQTQTSNTLDWSQKLADKGFLTLTELETDKLNHESARVQLEQAELGKKLLEQFDDPRKITELEANLKEADRGLERSKLKAVSMIADYKAALESSQAKLGLEQEKLNKLLDQIAKARVVAPVAGMVVYTRGEGGRMGMGEPVQEGSEVRERQEILTIPRTGGMIVEASLHESVLKQVVVGAPCTVQIDALPGQQFEGKVQFVALLPDKGSWWMNPNTRLYRTEISLGDTHPDVRPGMSCNIEILSEEIEDTLYVPLQSVVLDQGRTIAFVPSGETIETRSVRVGRNSEKWVEIKDGLNEGEEVLLSPPPGFTPQSTKDEREGGNGGRGAPGPGRGGRGAAPAAGVGSADAASPGEASAQEARAGVAGRPERGAGRARGEGGGPRSGSGSPDTKRGKDAADAGANVESGSASDRGSESGARPEAPAGQAPQAAPETKEPSGPGTGARQGESGRRRD